MVALDSLTTESEVEILPDFPAVVDGVPVWVTAVLERTAVVEPAPGAALEMIEPDFLLHLLVVALDAPAQLCETDEPAHWHRGRQARWSTAP